MQHITLICHDTGIPNMAKNSYWSIKGGPVRVWRETCGTVCVKGVALLRLVPTESWRVFASPVQTSGWLHRPPSGGWRQGLPLRLQVSHLPCLTLLIVSVYKVEHSHSYGCFVSEECLHLSSSVSLLSQCSLSGNYLRVEVVLQGCERIEVPLGWFWVDLGAVLLTSHSETKLAHSIWSL